MDVAPVRSVRPERVDTSLDAEQRAAAHLREIASRLLGTQLLPVALPHTDIPDAKQTWLLRDAFDAPRAVAQLSSAASPNMVARGVARAEAVRASLGPNERGAILPVLATGRFEGASYAVWPFCQPIPQRRPIFVARHAFMRPVFDWLREIARFSARRMTASTVAELDRQLCSMATQRDLPVRARLAARTALRRLDAGRWRPMHVAMHGDLHAGNVLFDHIGVTGRDDLPSKQRFVVIDWCGASAEGQPLVDLLRISESLRAPNAALAAELSVHCAMLGGDLEDAVAHAAAALAHLGAHLEYFPFDRYAGLTERVLSRLDAALINLGAS